MGAVIDILRSHPLSRMQAIPIRDSQPRYVHVWIRDKGRLTFRRALNAANASSAPGIAGYSSASNSGNNSVGDCPSSDRRLLDSSLTRALSMRSLFILLKGLRRSRHDVGLATLCHTGIQIYTRERHSTAEETALSALKICAVDDTCHCQSGILE